MAANASYLQLQVRRDVGDIGRNARHEILFPVGATGGTWNFTLAGSTAPGIAWPNTVATVQAELEALAPIGAGNVSVKLGARGFVIEYQNDLGAQEIPVATVDGTSLTPEGSASVPIKEIIGKPNHWTDARIAAMWDRRDNFSDIELRFLYVKLDAIEELKGLVWTQIDEETGDQKRAYEKQFAHLLAMEESTLDAIGSRLNGNASEAAANAGTSIVGQPLIRQTVQAKFDRLGREWCNR